MTSQTNDTMLCYLRAAVIMVGCTVSLVLIFLSMAHGFRQELTIAFTGILLNFLIYAVIAF